MAFQTHDPASVLALAQHHLTEGVRLLNEYNLMVGNDYHVPVPAAGQVTPGVPTGAAEFLAKKPKGSVSSLEKFANWLRHNQPAVRQDIADAVGSPLAATANAHIIKWEPHMASWPDQSIPPDTVCQIQAMASGKGRPPVIYFLWSQRFEVRPLFNVGPEGPIDPMPVAPPPATVTTPAPLLGVVHPPTETDTLDWDDVTDDTTDDGDEEAPEPDGPQPFETLDDWYAQWLPLFKELVPHDAVPTDEERAEMFATMPTDVADPRAIIATAPTKARQELRDAG